MNTTHRQPGGALWFALMVLAVTGILITSCSSIAHSSFASSHTPTSVSVTSTPTLDLSDPLVYRRQEIAEMREQLQTPNLDPTSRAALERNIAIMEHDVQRIETARARPSDWEAPTNVPRTPLPTRPRPTGILERFNHPPPYSNDVTFTSAWQDQVDGEWLKAYTGVRENDPTQGFVYVKGGKRGEYPTPTQVGAVTITSYEGTVLTLTSADGTTFLFDVAIGTFVSE